MSSIEKSSNKSSLFETLERFEFKDDLPGFNVIKTRNGIETDVYSYGGYGQGEKRTDSDTVYDLASVSKIYTTALVLRQVQDGTMELDGEMSRYIDGDLFQNSSLTVRDLLSHKVTFNLQLAQYRDQFSDSFKESLMNIQVPINASKGVYYHNLGYIYLGYALENITDRSLSNQLKDLFFDLELTNSYTGDSQSIGGGEVVCPATEIMKDGTVIANVTHDESARLHGGVAGNAGVFASARDLVRFGDAWISGQVVNDELFKESLRNYDANGDTPQGLGWWMRMKDGTILPNKTYGHSGFTGCYLMINPAKNESMAIMTNRTLYGRDNVADQALWKAVVFF